MVLWQHTLIGPYARPKAPGSPQGLEPFDGDPLVCSVQTLDPSVGLLQSQRLLTLITYIQKLTDADGEGDQSHGLPHRRKASVQTTESEDLKVAYHKIVTRVFKYRCAPTAPTDPQAVAGQTPPCMSCQKYQPIAWRVAGCCTSHTDHPNPKCEVLMGNSHGLPH